MMTKLPNGLWHWQNRDATKAYHEMPLNFVPVATSNFSSMTVLYVNLFSELQ